MSRIESPELQLIELLRQSDAPTDEDMQRVSDAVGVKLALGLGSSTAVLAVTRTSWAARLGWLGWGKGLLVASSLVGVGFGATWYARPEALLPTAAETTRYSPRATTPSTGAAASESTVMPAKPSEKEATVSKEEPSETEHRTRAPSSKTARTTASTLEAEMALLGRAQKALNSGQPGEALRVLDEHAKRFPSGVLALERSGIRTVALCQSGRLDEGRTAARNYQRLVPNSTLAKRIRIACQLADE